MKSTHLTVMVFCHVLLASVVLYFTSSVLATPLTHQPQQQQQQQPQPQLSHHHHHQPLAEVVTHHVHPPAVPVAAPKAQHVETQQPQQRSAAPSVETKPIVKEEPVVQHAIKPIKQQPATLTERKAEIKPAEAVESKPVVAPAAAPAAAPVAAPVVAPAAVPVVKHEEVKAKSDAPHEVAAKVEQQSRVVPAPVKPTVAQPASAVQAPVPAPQQVVVAAAAAEKPQPVAAPQAAALVAPVDPIKSEVRQAPSSVVVKEEPAAVMKQPVVHVSEERKFVEQPANSVVIAQQPANSAVVAQQPAASILAEQQQQQQQKPAPAPVVMGGLGPLHLLASTLCSYQADKPSADEHLNQLYARRASVRKSLFDFMSLKFTNLEKLSSRLGYGLQVVPVKSQMDNKSPSVTPSHGWPVVGKCTAYDLKLMGEAAWCECQEGDFGCPMKKPEEKLAAVGSEPAPAPVQAVPAPAAVVSASDEQPAKITSNQHAVQATKMARSISSNSNSFLPSPEESSVISKLLHVGDIKDTPTVESTIYNLNLTQHQLATLEAHATSTQECRRNALRYSKALFNHLAEDQTQVSESWPRLYELISNDDCARKRMIDIFNALSGFRTDTTSIRRDNLEFAFAMDDLRVKVLESETNVPLTFDRHFIEVEQFLQQSVRLMLANIQPKRAKLTSMRYRSLMYGASPQAADDQCIDLHQRLLSRNYPNDCNPTQFGQLPDSLRMTASSLELWSIEKELSMHTAKVADYPNSSAVGQQKVKENVNECIANLVSS